MKVRPRSLLELHVYAEIERRRRAKAITLSTKPVLDAIPIITPKYASPKHLQPLADLIDRAKRGEAIRALISVPPQHGKTETVLHGIAQLLAIFPERTYAYVTYGASLSHSKSRDAIKYARAAGVRLDDTFETLGEWRTMAGGGFFATSIDGTLTGQRVNGGLIIDDPFKGREEAESLLIRDKVQNFLTGTGIPRTHPSAFIFIVHTRWHEDDLIGRLAKELIEDAKGVLVPTWEVINLPAISDDGKALWPESRPLSFLQDIRASIGEYDWWALYQGNPRPRGNNVFSGVQYYDTLPNRYRIGKGFDLSYTAKNRSDFSAAVVIAESDGDVYVLDMRHKRSDVAGFVPDLQELDALYPGHWNFICSGMEAAAIDLAPTGDIQYSIISATTDKYARAQPISARWNGEVDHEGKTRPGRVFLPRKATWLREFIDEVSKFTGVSDAHDDIVDALSSAFWDFKGGCGVGLGVSTTVSGAGTRYEREEGARSFW